MQPIDGCHPDPEVARVPRHITRKGYQAIQEEIDHLWHEERPFMVQQVHDAAALGDRSENAEYIYGKKRLRQIDGRIRYLTRKVQDVVVIDTAEQVTWDDVRFGALVRVEQDDGEERNWRLVDKEESDPKNGRISVQSPVGRALLGRKVGDFFEVKLPRGVVEMEILEIRYGEDEL
ncbi:MAG: GreA/GreB family elongation factor [Myxococcota bacterium]|nr:GreA/GreB family elongation factor [Myxococcota bacterium]